MFSGISSLLRDTIYIFNHYLPYAWQIIKSWWWLPVPFILWKPFSFLYLWWRNTVFLAKQKFVLYEIKIPKDVLKPIRAMETVMDHLWQILYDPPNWWEKWIEGKMLLSYSFEIVSIGGNIHFLIRGLKASRDSIEAAIYSQYPDAEISIIDDYTKYVPADIPNKDWDLWGADYRLLKDTIYPIKTYKEFETEREAIEEKIIDPVANVLEASARINPGEQIWIQIIASPVTDADYPWISKGKNIRDKLARREQKTKSSSPSIIQDASDIMIRGIPPGGVKVEGKSEIIPPEMKLTPGEREVISAVERKMAKRGFKCTIRFIYLGKKDVFFKPKIRLPLSFLAAFGSENLNTLVPYGQPLITKVVKSLFLPWNLIRNRRLFLRKRSIFKKYKLRVSPLFPREEPEDAKKKSEFILNTEELATIFHFPGRRVAPAPFVERIESKKGEAPPGLPTE